MKRRTFLGAAAVAVASPATIVKALPVPVAITSHVMWAVKTPDEVTDDLRRMMAEIWKQEASLPLQPGPIPWIDRHGFITSQALPD